MSHEQFPEPELALLLDLGKLLKRYGPEVFKSLAEALADPEWSSRLSIILGTVATTRSQQPPVRKPRPKRALSDRVGAQLRNADAAHAALLEPIAERWITGESLPRLKDVAEFALTVGIPAPSTRSRGDAIVDVVRALAGMPTDELENVLPALELSAGRSQRSLEGWNRIIERSRASTHRPEAR